MLSGKTAIVTGAARGIGKAIARRYLEEGASVAVCDIREDSLQAAEAELSRYGNVLSRAADVSSPDSIARFLDAMSERFGDIDILANNAGISPVSPFLDLSVEAWDRTMQVNLRGAFLVAQETARRMANGGKGGVIVNMASTNGLFGEELLAAYNASKGGVVLLTKTMALELAPRQIRVNAVCPGLIRTELAVEGGFEPSFIEQYLQKIPLGRYGTPEEVADLFVFLSSDRSSFITGQTFVIDGGQTAGQ
jgi:3-oxoacyl-[acyl-carrier protein] reductase